MQTSSLELQVELLSASSVRYTNLAIDIMHDYVEYIKKLVDLVFPIENTEKFRIFWNSKYENHFEKSYFHEVSDYSENERQSIIEVCINLVKQTVKSWSLPNTEIRNEMNLCVLHVFRKTNLTVKIICIEYFIHVLRLESSIDFDLNSSFTGILRGLSSMYEKYIRNDFELWQELEDLFDVATKFLNKLMNCVKLFENHVFCDDIFDVTLEIIRLTGSNPKLNSTLDLFYNACLVFADKLLRECDWNLEWFNKIRGLMSGEYM